MPVMRRRKKPSGEIPTASMADIAFLLLIFFLVTTVFDEERGLSIVLPQEEVEQEVSQKNVLHLVVQPDGLVRVKRGEDPNEEIRPASDIGSIWRLAFSQNDKLIAAVKTDPNASYRYMIAVLDQLQAADAERISLQMLEN